MVNLSGIMISLILFGMMITGPVLYYGALVTNAETEYGVTITQSRNTSTFRVASEVITKAHDLQQSTESMTTGDPFTDFVNMLVAGADVLHIMWDFTGMFTNIINDFVSILGISGEGAWISAGIVGIILIIITTKILGVVMNREI